jgi:hypothetical protein
MGGFLLVNGRIHENHCSTISLASKSELSVGAQPQASMSSPGHHFLFYFDSVNRNKMKIMGVLAFFECRYAAR